MPYRLSYWEGVRFYRWLWIWYGANAIAIGCTAVWIGLASTRRQRIGGIVALAGVIVLIFFAHPTWVHSITSAKNLCIDQLREIDAAKEQWAEQNRKKVGDEVDVDGVVDFLKRKELPKCPIGGAYLIGKVGETPRCRVLEHELR